MFSISLMAIPAFLTAPTDIALKQFKTIYDIGKLSTPPACLVSAGTFLYLSYRNYALDSNSPWMVFLGAGISSGTVLALTYIALERSSQTLIRLEKLPTEKIIPEEEVKAALRRWKLVNFIRSGLFASSAILSFQGFLQLI